MQKIIITLSMLALSTAVFGSAKAQDQAALEGRVKLLEDRLDKIEQNISALIMKKAGPLNEANMPDDQVQQWATSSVNAIYSYDFANVDNTLARLRYLFTPAGYDSFLKALKDSGNLKFVQDKKLIVNAQTNGAAKIDAKGLDGNNYAWRISVPVTVTYQNSLEKFSQNIVVEVEVIRTDSDQADAGVAINYVNASLAPKPGEKAADKPAAPAAPATGNEKKPAMPTANGVK